MHMRGPRRLGRPLAAAAAHWQRCGQPAVLASGRWSSGSAAAAGGPPDQVQGLPFAGIRHNQRAAKPRTTGLTEIRGPYYTAVTPTYLRELLEGVGHAVDGLKFAGGAFSVLRRPALRSLLDVAHQHGAYVSTGGWIEHVLTQGQDAVQAYLQECKAVGFDTVELSTGFISLPTEDLVRLVRDVQRAGLKPKPEVGIQFGAGGDTPAAELAAEGTVDVSWAIRRARRCLEAGAEMVMIESEGITEDVAEWRTDVVSQLVDGLGQERLMFEAADPKVFSWYVKTFGTDVNLFVDHSQVVQLECLRRGIWGTKSLWGRVLSYKPPNDGSGTSSSGYEELH